MSNPEAPIEPEVLPPTRESDHEAMKFKDLAVPLVSAILIDFLDMLSFDRFGIALGAIIGAVCGVILARVAGLSSKYWGIVALITAVYAGMPRTGIFPLATIFAVATLFKKLGDDPKN